MRDRVKILPCLLLAVCLGLTLCACGGKNAAMPETYQVTKDETLPAFGKALPEETKDGLAYTPLEEGKGDEGVTSYQYNGLTNGGVAVESYVSDLTANYDCQIIDEENTATQPPDYTQEEGSVIVGKDSEDGSGLCVLTLKWTGVSCTVERTFQKGESIQQPENLSLTDAADEVKSYLQGQGYAADDYVVWADEGLVRLDNMVCIQVKVYTADEYAIQDTYLVAAQGGEIYRLDRDSRTATPVN